MSAARRLLFVLVLGLGGCMSARFVSVGSDGGVVAVPDNSNGFPFYYRNQADKLIKERFPHGYTVVQEEEVATGTATVSAADAQKVTTTTQDVKGWRITSRAK